MQPKIAVIVFPGGNCEVETARAVAHAGMTPVLFRWNDDPAALESCDGFVIGGGFSYQDRVRAGAIAAKEPILEAVSRAADAGKPVLGICNGAQVLVESGLVPALSGSRLDMALAPNKMMRGQHVVRQGYLSGWARLQCKVKPERTAFTLMVEEGETLPIPYAHAEGRFVTSDPEVEKALVEGRHVVFAYTTPAGEAAVDFPDNPNGSLMSAAAVCNRAGNAMAIMPHPERADLLRHVPTSLGDSYAAERRRATGDASALVGPGPGRKFFASMQRFLGGKS